MQFQNIDSLPSSFFMDFAAFFRELGGQELLTAKHAED
jgi:hypothetical protein